MITTNEIEIALTDHTAIELSELEPTLNLSKYFYSIYIIHGTPLKNNDGVTAWISEPEQFYKQCALPKNWIFM